MFSQANLPLTTDGRIYHLNLHPDEVADMVITVGDLERVKKVSQHFDSIECKIQNREFLTHTGYIGHQRLSVISTGIGTSNIDIVLNELDALKNIDLDSRKIKSSHKSLDIIRFGTTGSIQPQAPLGCNIITQYAIGLDGLMAYYQYKSHGFAEQLNQAFQSYIPDLPLRPYVAEADSNWLEKLKSIGIMGSTVTSPGFYAPQDRPLRADAYKDNLLEQLKHFEHQGIVLTNFEMETAAILALGQILGHRCASISVVLANRLDNTFCTNCEQVIEQMIGEGLQQLID